MRLSPVGCEKCGLAFADTLSDARERSAARNAVFFTWAENDPRTAARHALNSGDPDARIMLGSVGYHWAAKDPEGAARFALENDLPQDNKQPSGHLWKPRCLKNQPLKMKELHESLC